MRRFFVILAAAVFLAGVAAAASGGGELAGTRWVVKDLGTLGGAESYAAAINSKGQVVGWAETKKGKTHPFLWRGGRLTDLGTLDYTSAWATGINDRGQVVGRVLTVGGEEGDESAPRGFLWQRGSMTELWGDHDKFADEAAYSEVRAINGQGQIVGWAHADSSDNPYASHAMLWRAPVARPPAYLLGLDLSRKQDDQAEAYAVNERGQVVGESQRTYKPPTRATLWENGKLTYLGTLPGRRASKAAAINDRGQVVGDSFNQVGEYGERRAEVRAFLWQKRKMSDLGTLDGLRHSSAVAINERGQVIGWSAPALGEDERLPPKPRAFIWQNGKLTDLGTLGGASAIPFAINDRGQVVGQSQTRDGRWHAFVWETGRMTALPTLGGKVSAALAINDEGWIVGWSRTPKDVKHAVLWQAR